MEKAIRPAEWGGAPPLMSPDTICTPSVTSSALGPSGNPTPTHRGLPGTLLQFNIFAHRHLIISEPDTGSIIL